MTVAAAMPKLFLADDSATIRRVIELTFWAERIQVVVVADGREAIARIPLEKPDIVLVDLSMPEPSGYAVAEFVRGCAELAHVPIVVLADGSETVDQARVDAIGGRVMAKPFDPQRVIDLVRQLLLRPNVAPPPPTMTTTLPAEPEDKSLPSSLDDILDRLNAGVTAHAARSAQPPVEAVEVDRTDGQSRAQDLPTIEALLPRSAGADGGPDDLSDAVIDAVVDAGVDEAVQRIVARVMPEVEAAIRRVVGEEVAKAVTAAQTKVTTMSPDVRRPLA